MATNPSYLSLYQQEILAERARVGQDLLRECALCSRLCSRLCHVNRFESRAGICRTNARPVVSAHHPHFGEEAVLVGRHGSGTILFTSCNLRCVFCQNWEISHLRAGTEISHHRLAEIMVELQALGRHNINLVTPAHMIPQILAALPDAIAMGLSTSC
jgi:putative pyruvate formate lyase activating enzyme